MRMRLQLETNSADLARSRLPRDIGLMQSMVTSALAFLSFSTGSRQASLPGSSFPEAPKPLAVSWV